MTRKRVVREEFPLMQMYYWLFACAFAIVVFGLLAGCEAGHRVNKLLGLDKSDGFAEEAVELVIEHEIGISLDLSPNSPE